MQTTFNPAQPNYRRSVMDGSQIVAEYTAGKTPELAINRLENGRRFWLATYRVNGKREARKVAARFDATPWNF